MDCTNFEIDIMDHPNQAELPFVDFFGEPYVKPSEKNSLCEILSNNFEIKNIYLLRDPIEMFISCNTKLIFFSKNYSFDTFLKGYNAYLENIKENKFIKYESFIHNTSENLRKISRILDFKYDENYYKNLENTRITGDIGATKSTYWDKKICLIYSMKIKKTNK